MLIHKPGSVTNREIIIDDTHPFPVALYAADGSVLLGTTVTPGTADANDARVPVVSRLQGFNPWAGSNTWTRLEVRNANDAGAPTNGSLAVNLNLRSLTDSAYYPAAGSNADSIPTQYVQIVSMGGLVGASGIDRMRLSNIFKPVALGAGTAETTIWTPAAGKKFRLLGFLLTCGAASTLTFKDNTGGTTIFATRGGIDVPIRPAAMGNGILSAAANNVLTVIRGTSCTLDGTVWGIEE